MVRLNFANDILLKIFYLRKWVFYGEPGDTLPRFTPNNGCNNYDIFISTFSMVARSHVVVK